MRDRRSRGREWACGGVDAIGGGKIFATHYLDHPYRGDTQVLGGWSYVWAGLFGPFYLLATYAFIRGRDWIRLPAIIWATMMFTIVCIILNEEAFGLHRTDHLPQVIGANLSWLVFPILVVWRVGGSARVAIMGALRTVGETHRRHRCF